MGGDDAPAVAVSVDAATERTSACPTSAVAGLYVSSVAPGIATHPAPAASQRSHWYVNVTGFAAAPGARDAGEDGPRARGARNRRRGRDDGRRTRRIARDRHRRGIRPVQPVAVAAVDEARDLGAVGPLPERPAEAAPVRRGDATARRSSSSARSTAGSPRSREARRVAEGVLPEARRRVDETADAGARLHLAEPRLRPLDERRRCQRALRLEVEHRWQVPGRGLRDVDEVVGLRDRVGHDPGRAGAGRPREVVRAEAEPDPCRAGAVDRVRRVGERRPLGRLREQELVAAADHLDPVDGAVPVRDVEPLRVAHGARARRDGKSDSDGGGDCRKHPAGAAARSDRDPHCHRG